MVRLSRGLIALVFCATGLLFAAQARAECGGIADCMGISVDPAVAPAHGTPLAATLPDFGSQNLGTTSASKTVLAALVFTNGTGFASLTGIALSGTNAADFVILPSGTCAVGVPLRQTTANQAQLADACAIQIAFSPASPGTKSASLQVSTTSIARTIALSGTGTTPLPTATATTMTAQASTPTLLDLAGFIGGTGTLSVRLTSAPAHGTATLSGTRVTYTPAAGYLGADAFTYDVTDSFGTSAPATVTVAVVTRPDPAADATVRGTLRAQGETARRFSRAQTQNVMQRMESLHARRESRSGPAARYTDLPNGARLDTRADTPTALKLPGSSAVASNEATLLPAALTNALVGLASTRSLNLSAAGTGSGASAGETGVWIGGSVQFGSRDQTTDTNALRFSTDGVTAGVDRRLNDRLALGFSVGYASDRTDIGTDGSKNTGKGTSLALYGSYQPSTGTFIDAMLGYGALELQSDRFVAAAGDFARGTRKGDQWFGALAAGYEFRSEGLLLSPYGRLDYSRARLKQYSESGAGLAALTYHAQSLPTLQAALGVRAESVHETSFGWALPRVRLEFRHDFRGERQATLAYADLPAGPVYAMPVTTNKRNFFVLGLGSDFIVGGGTRLGVDYQIQRASGIDHGQAFRVWLSQALDGKGFSPGLLATRLFSDPVRVEGSMFWDDNINRARDAHDKRADHGYAINLIKNWVFPLTENVRLSMAGSVGGDKSANFPGLDRFSAGGQAELQYRASGEFFTPTFGLLGRLTLEEYPGTLRSGRRESLGLTYRQTLTDRIDLYAAYAHNARRADADAFATRDRALRFNLDYALGAAGSVYLAGERRRGDVVSTVDHHAGYATFAKASVPDPVYRNPDFTAYRFDAKTALWTLGYNLPLGARDALDFSARRATSQPTNAPTTGIYAGASRYVANQYSIAYLMRF